MPYSAADVRARSRILRALLVGPPKGGKTTTAVRTLPPPVFVFNTDGRGALDPVVQLSDDDLDFEAEDITSGASFTSAYLYLRQNAGRFRSVVFDNLTFYADVLFTEVVKDVGTDGRTVYPELVRRMNAMVRSLFALKHHVVLIGQVDPGETDIAGALGHMLLVTGKCKISIPAMVQDEIYLETVVTPTGPKWEFLLAPQGKWTKGVRSVQAVPRMEANFTKFLELAEKGALPKARMLQKTQDPTPTQQAKPAAPPQARPAAPAQTRPATPTK